MKYTHQITFFNREKKPVLLTQDQISTLKAMKPMPDMIWVGDQCYNRSSIEDIVRMPRRPDQEKCLQCHEYKPYGKLCPTCAAKTQTPEEKAEVQKKVDAMKNNLGEKLGWQKEI